MITRDSELAGLRVQTTLPSVLALVHIALLRRRPQLLSGPSPRSQRRSGAMPLEVSRTSLVHVLLAHPYWRVSLCTQVVRSTPPRSAIAMEIYTYALSLHNHHRILLEWI